MVFSVKQILTADFIQEGQLVYGHQIGNVFVGRIIKEQQHFPRLLIIGRQDSFHHPLQDFCGKRIKKVETVCYCIYRELLCFLEYELQSFLRTRQFPGF